MTVYLGADHGGFDLKEQLKHYLSEKGVEFEDVGNTTLDEGDDYPDFGLPAAEKAAQTNGRGILLCRTGTGMCMVANKVEGVRAVQGHTVEIVKRSREDEDSNVLCIASDYTSFDELKKMVDVWLETPFSREDRHARRIQKVSDIERL